MGKILEKGSTTVTVEEQTYDVLYVLENGKRDNYLSIDIPSLNIYGLNSVERKNRRGEDLAKIQALFVINANYTN